MGAPHPPGTPPFKSILKDFKITPILFSFKKPTTSAKIALVGNCGLTLHTVSLAPPGARESQPSLKIDYNGIMISAVLLFSFEKCVMITNILLLFNKTCSFMQKQNQFDRRSTTQKSPVSPKALNS